MCIVQLLIFDGIQILTIRSKNMEVKGVLSSPYTSPFLEMRGVYGSHVDLVYRQWGQASIHQGRGVGETQTVYERQVAYPEPWTLRLHSVYQDHCSKMSSWEFIRSGGVAWLKTPKRRISFFFCPRFVFIKCGDNLATLLVWRSG